MPLTLSLTNLVRESLDLQVRLVPAQRPEGVAAGVFLTPTRATLRQARLVAPASETGTEYPAVLPRLDESQTLGVGPAGAAQLWLDVDTAGMEPGCIPVALQLTPQQDLESRGIPLAPLVLPFRPPGKCPAEVFCRALQRLQTLGESRSMPQEEISRLRLRRPGPHPTAVRSASIRATHLSSYARASVSSSSFSAASRSPSAQRSRRPATAA